LSFESLAIARPAVSFRDADARVCQEALKMQERVVEVEAADSLWATHSEFQLLLYRAAGRAWSS
jgi:DNA-binding GntR family transcriptional regulator